MIKMVIELILKGSPNCVLTEKAERERKEMDGDLPLVRAINLPTDLKFNITDGKLYVLLVTLKKKYESELYKNLKTEISFDFEWGRYRTQVINQPATNNVNFSIDLLLTM